HDSASGDFEFRNLAARVKSPVGETIGAPRTRPVIRNEDGIRADRLDDQSTNGEIVAARSHRYPISVFDPTFFSEPRMQFRAWLWILVNQRSDAPRLRARQILAHHSTRCQVERVLLVDRITTRPPFRLVEVCLAVVRVELLVREKKRR